MDSGRLACRCLKGILGSEDTSHNNEKRGGGDRSWDGVL